MNNAAPTYPRIFGARLVTRGWHSLPFTPLVVWLGLAWWAGKNRPERSLGQRLATGLVMMPALLGWEWLHNLAHAAAAQLAGKPMDELEILAGMPICIYSTENHRSATPRQHIQRALGGPLFNVAMMLVTRVMRSFSRQDSLAHEVLDVAVDMNTFLSTASLLPIPGIDGGPILKWALVSSGKTPEQGDLLVQKADLVLSPILGGITWLHCRRKRWISAALAGFFSIVALAVGMGWMKGETRET